MNTIKIIQVKSSNIFFKILILVVFLFQNQLFSQDSISTADSLKVMLSKDFKKEEKKVTKSQQFFIDNQNSKKQRKILSEINEEIQNANLILKRGIDYKNFTSELKAVSELQKKAFDDVLKSNKNTQSVRNLTLTAIWLDEILLRTEVQMKKIKKNSDELSKSQTKLDSLIISDVLYISPNDEQAKKLYLKRFDQVTQDVESLNDRFKKALDSINALEINADQFKFSLQDNIITTDKLRNEIQSEPFYTNKSLFDKKQNPNVFSETFGLSFAKEFALLIFYISNHFSLIVLIVLVVIGIASYLKILKRKYKQAGFYDDFKYPIQIFKHPIVTAIIIAITVVQFFFPSPPFAFLSILWTILLFCLARFFRKINSKTEKRVWRIFGAITLFSFFLNNILQPSVTEVILLVIMALATMLASVYFAFKHPEEFSFPMIHVLKGVAIMELIGVILLVFLGNYNLGKVMVTNGVFIIFLSHLLLVTIYRILDIIKFSDYLKEPEDDQEVEINLNSYESHEIGGVKLLILILGLFVLIFRNSFWYQSLIGPFTQSLSEEQKIGSFSFSYGNIILFFVVIFVSSFISKIVSFLSTGSRGTDASTKNQIGSWMLLIRIAIMSIGVLLAFVVSGFPIDKITIILSALGVGIGLGLQTLTNNLVSGLIIAFEKPINIGDIIEVGGQLGKMKSIGIRSSVITTFDGADVIIPNGELLNQNLTNWTLGSSKRRFEIKLGVAYGTDLEKAKQILQDILLSNEDILKSPEPMIWVMNFGDSSIDFSIKFWVIHFGVGNDVLSDVLISIDKKFKENNIEIPFPQRDLHIKGDTNVMSQEKTK